MRRSIGSAASRRPVPGGTNGPELAVSGDRIAPSLSIGRRPRALNVGGFRSRVRSASAPRASPEFPTRHRETAGRPLSTKAFEPRGRQNCSHAGSAVQVVNDGDAISRVSELEAQVRGLQEQ